MHTWDAYIWLIYIKRLRTNDDVDAIKQKQLLKVPSYPIDFS